MMVRRFTAHPRQTMVVVFVEGMGAQIAVGQFHDITVAALCPCIRVAVPADAVHIDLRINILLLQTLHGGAERLLAFARRPEERIVRVIRIRMPPIPIQRQFRLRAVLFQLLDRRDDILYKTTVPEPEVNVAQRVVFRTIRHPALLQRPWTVDLRGLIPTAFEELHIAFIRHAALFRRRVALRAEIDAGDRHDAVFRQRQPHLLQIPFRIAEIVIDALSMRPQDGAELHGFHRPLDVVLPRRDDFRVEREAHVPFAGQNLGIDVEADGNQRELDFRDECLSRQAVVGQPSRIAAIIRLRPFGTNRKVFSQSRMAMPYIDDEHSVFSGDDIMGGHVGWRHGEWILRPHHQQPAGLQFLLELLQRIDLRTLQPLQRDLHGRRLLAARLFQMIHRLEQQAERRPIIDFADFHQQPRPAVQKLFVCAIDPAHPVAGDASQNGHCSRRDVVQHKLQRQMAHQFQRAAVAIRIH